MAKKFRYQHIMSAVEGKLPTAEQLKDGEIAVNVFAGSEKLALKNSEGEVVTFKTDAQFEAELAEKDAKISALSKELMSLKQIVGDMGGAVSYNVPEDGNFVDMMKNSGTVKLTADVVSKNFYPSAIAANTTTLNLNGKNLTVTGLTPTSSTGAITARYKENLTIKGGGVIDAGEGIAIMCSGEDAVVTLEGGSMFGGGAPVYQNSKTEGELIYCYSGLININGGTFKGNGSTFTLNCYDANYRSGKANIVVASTSKTSGPHFFDFDPANNSAEGAGTNFVADGCVSVNSGVITSEMVGTKTYGYTITEEDVDHVIYSVIKEG